MSDFPSYTYSTYPKIGHPLWTFPNENHDSSKVSLENLFRITYIYLNQLEDMRIQSNVWFIGAHFLNQSQTLNSNSNGRKKFS